MQITFIEEPDAKEGYVAKNIIGDGRLKYYQIKTVDDIPTKTFVEKHGKGPFEGDMEYTTDFKGFEEWNFHITTHMEEGKCKNCICYIHIGPDEQSGYCTWRGFECRNDECCKDFEEKEK